MLIKTDSQNYTDIANAIRGLTGGTEQYKPEEMKPALDAIVPDYGVSYDTFDADGNVLTATTYGCKVSGFAGHEHLQTVNISNKATEVCNAAFANTGIESLELPSGVTKIGDDAFFGSSIKTITLPETITEIGDSAFGACAYLTINTLPTSVTRIGSHAFNMAGYLAASGNDSFNYEFVIPENVDYIGTLAFYNCPYKVITFKGTPNKINSSIFGIFGNDVEVINVPWSEDAIINIDAPWGATNATINYNYTDNQEV